MPPKGTGRGVARGRGRGGRPRGGEAEQPQDPAAPIAPEPLMEVVQPKAEESEARPIDAPAFDRASQANASEASEPIRIRLTPTPAPISSRASPATRGGTAASKFRPKGVRRAEEDRERLAQEQLAIQNQRIAEEARLRARANRARGRGRGRGDRGRGGSGSGRGAFGALGSGSWEGPASAGYNRAGGLRGPGGSSFAGNSFRNNNLRAVGQASYATLPDPDDYRINADQLYGFVADEDDDGANNTAKKKYLRPMGTMRIEHEEEKVVMASSKDIEAQNQGDDDDAESDSSNLFVDGATFGETEAHIKDDGQTWEHAAPKNPGTVKMKTEDGRIIETMDFDLIAQGQVIKEPDSPERRKKDIVGEEVESSTKIKKPKAHKDPERQNRSDDLAYMLSTLGMRSSEEDKDEVDLDGELYMFQFPPIFPPLATKEPLVPRNPVKDEPDDDLALFPEVPAKSVSNIDLTKDDEGKVKEEEEEEEGGKKKEKDLTSQDLKEPGYVGNLVLRKSGKVELIWGGQTFDLVPGARAQFLTTATLLEDADFKTDIEDEKYVGKAYGMGKIAGKFVVAPRFGEEEDWVVDPKEVKMPMENPMKLPMEKSMEELDDVYD